MLVYQMRQPDPDHRRFEPDQLGTHHRILRGRNRRIRGWRAVVRVDIGFAMRGWVIKFSADERLRFVNSVVLTHRGTGCGSAMRWRQEKAA